MLKYTPIVSSATKLLPLTVIPVPGGPDPGDSEIDGEAANAETAPNTLLPAGPPSFEPLVGPQPSILLPSPAPQVDVDLRASGPTAIGRTDWLLLPGIGQRQLTIATT
jgi:hypothetical protein